MDNSAASNERQHYCESPTSMSDVRSSNLCGCGQPFRAPRANARQKLVKGSEGFRRLGRFNRRRNRRRAGETGECRGALREEQVLVGGMGGRGNVGRRPAIRPSDSERVAVIRVTQQVLWPVEGVTNVLDRPKRISHAQTAAIVCVNIGFLCVHFRPLFSANAIWSRSRALPTVGPTPRDSTLHPSAVIVSGFTWSA